MKLLGTVLFVLSASTPAATTTPQPTDLLTPAEVRVAQQIAAEEGRAVIKYELGEPSSRALVITAKGPFPVALASGSEITTAAHELSRFLQQRPQGNTGEQYRPSAQRLYVLLFKPLESLLGESRQILIMRDGELAQVPFETLIRRMRPANQPEFLVERFAFSYLPVTAELANISRRQTLDGRVAVFADPVFDRRDTRLLSRLPFAEAEANSIKALYPNATLYTGQAATKNALKRLSGSSVLHIATHGVVQEPLATSALALAGENGSSDMLTAQEIMRLDLHQTKLVVLSACETAVPANGKPEVGLSEAFLRAGAQTVVASLWPVDDINGANFMRSFYEALRRGNSPAEAVRAGKLALRASGRIPYAHPYFWATFINIGAP